MARIALGFQLDSYAEREEADGIVDSIHAPTYRFRAKCLALALDGLVDEDIVVRRVCKRKNDRRGRILAYVIYFPKVVCLAHGRARIHHPFSPVERPNLMGVIP
jgi:hypothetical protein